MFLNVAPTRRNEKRFFWAKHKNESSRDVNVSGTWRKMCCFEGYFNFYFRRWTTYQFLDLYNTVQCILLLLLQKTTSSRLERKTSKNFLFEFKRLHLKNIEEQIHSNIFQILDLVFWFLHKSLSLTYLSFCLHPMVGWNIS